jgi:hypothetical protein
MMDDYELKMRYMEAYELWRKMCLEGADGKAAGVTVSRNVPST